MSELNGNVVSIGGITKLDLPVDRVLEAAKTSLEGVVLLGYDKEGKLYFASSYADGGDVLWLLEQCKLSLMQVPHKDDL